MLRRIVHSAGLVRMVGNPEAFGFGRGWGGASAISSAIWLALSEGEQSAGDAVGGVTDYVFFAGKVAGDAADAELFNAVDVNLDGRGVLGCIARQRFRREGRGV